MAFNLACDVGGVDQKIELYVSFLGFFCEIWRSHKGFFPVNHDTFGLH